MCSQLHVVLKILSSIIIRPFADHSKSVCVKPYIGSFIFFKAHLDEV